MFELIGKEASLTKDELKLPVISSGFDKFPIIYIKPVEPTPSGPALTM